MTVHFQRRYGDSLNIDSYLYREMSVGVEHVGRLLNYLVITVHTFITAKNDLSMAVLTCVQSILAPLFQMVC